MGVDVHADTLDDGAELVEVLYLEAGWGFSGPSFVRVVEEGLSVVLENFTEGRYCNGGVV